MSHLFFQLTTPIPVPVQPLQEATGFHRFIQLTQAADQASQRRSSYSSPQPPQSSLEQRASQAISTSSKRIQALAQAAQASGNTATISTLLQAARCSATPPFKRPLAEAPETLSPSKRPRIEEQDHSDEKYLSGSDSDTPLSSQTTRSSSRKRPNRAFAQTSFSPDVVFPEEPASQSEEKNDPASLKAKKSYERSKTSRQSEIRKLYRELSDSFKKLSSKITSTYSQERFFLDATKLKKTQSNLLKQLIEKQDWKNACTRYCKWRKLLKTHLDNAHLCEYQNGLRDTHPYPLLENIDLIEHRQQNP